MHVYTYYHDYMRLSYCDCPIQVKFSKLKDEGNAHFSKGSYEQALGYYFQALNYCRKNDMFDEMATIRANCAQACLKLQMYSDAYSHCTQCLKFNPSSHKVRMLCVCVCACVCVCVHVCMCLHAVCVCVCMLCVYEVNLL